MHVLFLTDNFPPEVNAPASRTFEHCRAWVQAGNQVTVITCVPNFPVGRVFSGYRNRLIQREVMDGIDVIRVWSYVTANEGFLRRTLDYASYMVTAVLAAPIVRRPDIVVGTSPQFFTACAAWIVSVLKGRPFVFELRDLWPESIRAVGAAQNEHLLRWLEKLELLLYRKASAIVAVTESFKENLVARGIDGSRIHVVTNGVDRSQFRSRPKDLDLLKHLNLEDKFVAGYVGTHGMAHSLHTVLEAAGQLRNHQMENAIHVLFLGDGATKRALKSQTEAQHLDNVTFVDSVSKDEVKRYWSLLDVAIIHLKRADLFRTVIPSKLFEAMAMGIPVLHGVTGESAGIVEREKVGLLFEPENGRDLGEKLLLLAADTKLREELGRNGREASSRFDRAFLAEKMLGILEELVGERGTVPREVTDTESRTVQSTTP